MGQVSTLTHLPFKPICEDYHFLDQVVKDFKYNLDSILEDSIHTLELGASFDEADVVPSSVSSLFLHSVLFLIFLDFSLLLASNLINHGARLWLCFFLYHRQVKCQLQSCFITLPVIQLPLAPGLVCHLISF